MKKNNAVKVPPVNGPTPRELIAKISAAQKRADAARKNAQAAKASAKRTRKAFKQAKRAAKVARKAVKILKKVLGAVRATAARKKAAKARRTKRARQVTPTNRIYAASSSATPPITPTETAGVPALITSSPTPVDSDTSAISGKNHNESQSG